MRHMSTTTTTSSSPKKDGKEEETLREIVSDKMSDARTNAKEKISDARAKATEAASRGRDVARHGALSARDLVKKYGWTFVGTWLGIYFGTLGLLFAGLDYGWIDPATIANIHWEYPSLGGGEGVGDGVVVGDVDGKDDAKGTVEYVANYMREWEYLKPYAATVEKNPHIANFAMAWIAAKFTEPPRFALTLFFVPRVHRALGYNDPNDEADSQKDN